MNRRLIGVVIAAAWVLFVLWIFRETEEDRLADWLVRVAETLPLRETIAYGEFVDLERFGLRLDRNGIQDTFGKGTQARFLDLVDALRPVLVGSEVTVQKVSVQIDDDLADAEMVILWKRGEAQDIGMQQARVRVEGKLVRVAEGWRISSLRLAPAFGAGRTPR